MDKMASCNPEETCLGRGGPPKWVQAALARGETLAGRLRFLRKAHLEAIGAMAGGPQKRRHAKTAYAGRRTRLYCTTVVRQAAASFISCGLIHGRLLVGPDLSRRPVAMAGDQPVGIVPGGEIQQRQA